MLSALLIVTELDYESRLLMLRAIRCEGGHALCGDFAGLRGPRRRANIFGGLVTL